MANKHTVVTPDGKSHHRTSQNRVYGYAVAAGPRRADHVIADLGAEKARAEAQAARHQAVVDHFANGGTLVKGSRQHGSITYFAGVEDVGWMVERNVPEGEKGWSNYRYEATDEQIAAGIERVKADYIGYAAGDVERVAQYQSRIDDIVSSGATHVGKWEVKGWQSRPELAVKFAATERAYAHNSGKEVIVIEASHVVTGRKQKVEA